MFLVRGSDGDLIYSVNILICGLSIDTCITLKLTKRNVLSTPEAILKFKKKNFFYIISRILVICEVNDNYIEFEHIIRV